MAAKNKHLEDLIIQAATILKLDSSDAAQKLVDEKLQGLAAELFLEWLVAERRFESQSQQTEHWIARFYEEVYSDEQPDPTRIYERFNLNLPRASYVTRLLRARRLPQWRKAAQAELKTQLTRLKKKAEDAVKNGTAQVDDFDVSLSPGAADELRVLYDRFSESIDEKERPRPPKVKPVFGSARWFSVPADTVLLLLKEYDAEKKK